MTQNKAVLGGIAAVIMVMSVGYWFVTTNQYASALMAVSNIPATVSTQDGVAGATKQTDNPLVNPYGASAGGIVDARSMTVAQVVANLDATEFASLFSSVNGEQQVS